MHIQMILQCASFTIPWGHRKGITCDTTDAGRSHDNNNMANVVPVMQTGKGENRWEHCVDRGVLHADFFFFFFLLYMLIWSYFKVF